MTRPLHKAILLGATALALVAAPTLLNLSGFSDIAAYAKDNNGNGNGGGDGGGNGNGGGNDGGNGGGNGGGNSDNAKSSSESSETESKGNGNGSGSGKGKKVAVTEEVASTAKATKAEKTKNLNAQLASLNSLNRNINGLMNSSSKKMELVRDYIKASAALETAAANLAIEEETLGGLQTALDDFVTTAAADLVAHDDSTVYDVPTLKGLTDRATELELLIADDPDNLAAIEEQTALLAVLEAINNSDELAAVNDQQAVVDGLAAEVAELEGLTGEDDLKAALLAAANKNRVAAAGGEAYLTPEILAWATAKLDALTEAYQAQQ